MKKIFKYLFILTIMFILPNFVLADETDTTFDHIDINKSVSLKYTVSGNDKTYTKTLDSLADVKLYIVDKDNSNVRTPIDLSGATATDGTYRINGNFNKLYEGTDTFVKYLVEYTFNDQDIYTNLNSNTNKSITYSKEYSFNSEHNKSTDGGILINLQETNSIQNIPTMLTIKKELENNNTPPGTFTFNIKNASGTIIKTVNITIPEGSTSKEIYFESININTTYLVEEVPDSQNIYKLLSIESTKGDPTIAHDSNATTVRATSTEDVITVTAKNGSAVDHSKYARPNGDGTHEIELSVKGNATTDVEPASNVNILIIYDVSSSMTSNNVTTNPSRNRADYAEDVVHDFIVGLRQYQNPRDPRNIQVAVVTFGPTASGIQTWTTDLTDTTGVNRFFDDGVDGTVTNSHNYSRNNGTNWEAALQQAQAYLRNADGDPTFVILVTDGACTASGNGSDAINPAGNHPWTDFRPFYRAARDEARAIGTRANTTLYGIYAYGREADLLDDLIYYSQNGSDRPGMDGGTDETPNYYNANNTSALNEAVQDIFSQIVETMGVNSVSIEDGTTSYVATTSGEISNLLTVDQSSYKYWLEIPTVNNKFTRINLVTGDPIVYTVTDNGNDTLTITWGENNEVTVKGSTFPGGIRYQWEEANALYNVAPPEAHLNGSSVDWNLATAGTLLDGVNYIVTFNVWPSQTTYDLISDLDNNIKKYDDLDPEIKKYLIKNSDGSYSLRTNTTAKLTYDDSRDQVGSRDTYFVNPEPVATGVSEVSLVKEWENDLDDREADEIELYLTVDDKDYGPKDEGGKILPYVLRKTDDPNTNWRTQVFISTGLISLDRDTGTAIVREVGHEYGFREKPSDAYYWDLEVAIRRPMVINKANGELETVMLIKLTDEEIQKDEIVVDSTKKYLVKDGIEYFRICYRDENGNDIPDSCHIYRRATTDESNTISAKNYRRSNLNVTKIVENNDYDEDTTFKFELTVNDYLSKPTDVRNVWFSIMDQDENLIKNANVSGNGLVKEAKELVETEEGPITDIHVYEEEGIVTYLYNGVLNTKEYAGPDPKTGNPTYYTYYYYIPSGSTITAYLKPTWNLRFINLPNGSTYTFVETPTTGYDFVSAISVQDTITSQSGTTVNGTIKEYNTSYLVTYTNKHVVTDVEVIKVWNNIEGVIIPQNITVYLYKNNDTTTPIRTETLNEGNKWKYKWTGLNKFNSDGSEITYSVGEEVLNDYYTQINGYTIINTYKYTTIPVKKEWPNTPEDKKSNVTVKIKTTTNKYPAQLVLSKDNTWAGEFTVLEYELNSNNELVPLTYVVEEVSIEGINKDASGVFIDYNDTIHAIVGKWTSSVEGNMNSGFVIKNTYKAMPTRTITINKLSFKGKPLEGAVFVLFRFIGEGNSDYTREINPNSPGADWLFMQEATSDSTGTLIFNGMYDGNTLVIPGLYAGEYRLIEIKAPANCILPKGQWTIYLDLSSDESVVNVRKQIKSTDPTKTPAPLVNDDGSINIYNEEIPEIPTTGGIGIPHYDKYGLLLMILSIAIFLFNIINQRKQIENI